MVKVFDPTKRDPTVKVLKGFQEWVQNEKNRLPEAEASKAVQAFLKSGEYERMMQEYFAAKQAPPDIVISSRCERKRHYFWGGDPRKNFQYFKGYFAPDKNEIVLCANVIHNFLELKENLDRELTVAYDYNIKKKDLSQDQEFVCTQMRACKAQLSNFGSLLSEDLKQKMSASCAKYLLRNRGPNQNQFPLDVWVRYSGKLVEENTFCYFGDTFIGNGI